MKANPHNIKLVAVDMDGTFARDDYTYDIPRFQEILEWMRSVECQFVVASGNQYYQLRSHFPKDHEEMSFIAENGALVKDKDELLFSASIPKEAIYRVLETVSQYPEIKNVLCGLNYAYLERGKVNQDFFDFKRIYYHRLKWVNSFEEVEDQILKFAASVPVEKTMIYYG